MCLGAPGLAEFATYSYVQSGEILVQGDVAGGLHIQLHTGVPYGDPCGSLHFRLALQWPPRAGAIHAPARKAGPYADDTHLQGGQEDFLAVCEGMSIHLLLPHLLHHLLH